MTELAQGLLHDLPNAFAGDVEAGADIFEGQLYAITQAKAQERISCSCLDSDANTWARSGRSSCSESS